MRYTIAIVVLLLGSCSVNINTVNNQKQSLPENYSQSKDSGQAFSLKWKDYFDDPNLVSLIESALRNNQELKIIEQEIAISRNEVQARKGEYLPFAGIKAGTGVDRIPEYTWRGAVEKNLDVKENERALKSNSDFAFGAVTSWELDIWKKLRNAKRAAVTRYLSTREGRNFMITNLIGEIASSYYELLALDNKLEIINKNINIQSNALQAVKLQKESAKLTQLAVNRFEAQLLHTRNLQFGIQQKITETENKINFLTGRFAGTIPRNTSSFMELKTAIASPGTPNNLLDNRPDIKQANLELAAAELDVKSAKANFYPSFRLDGFIGFQAFHPSYLLDPASLLYSLAADMIAPVVNRNGIKAMYNTATAKQMQALEKYRQCLLNAFLEVENQLANARNLRNSFETKSKEAEILNNSISISNNLFQSARADYIEVLLTQREAVESVMELVEIKLNQMANRVQLYRALGGGWQ